jgi:hypothetical protein
MKYKTARLRGVDRRDFLRGAGAVASSLAGCGVDHSWQRRGGQSPLDKEKAQEHHPDVRPAPLADALTESLPDYGKKTVITAGLTLSQPAFRPFRAGLRPRRLHSLGRTNTQTLPSTASVFSAPGSPRNTSGSPPVARTFHAGRALRGRAATL